MKYIVIILFVLGVKNNSYLAQNHKKIFQNIQNNDISSAYLEFKSYSSDKDLNLKKKVLLLTAKCILQTYSNLEIYSPYKSKLLYDSIFLNNNIIEIDKIDDFLSKYDIKRTEIVDKIDHSIFDIAKQKNSLAEFNKAITFVSNSYKTKLIELHEELYFNIINSNKRLDSIRFFINLYPNSKFRKEADELLESSLYFSLINKPNIDSLNSFILKYSNSKFLNKIIDSRDSIAMPKIETYASILNYTKQYPKSKFSNQLNEKLPYLFFTEIKKSKKIKDCIDFIYKYPNFKEIKSIAYILENKYSDSLINFYSDKGFKEFKSFFPNSKKINDICNSYLNTPSKHVKERYILSDKHELYNITDHINWNNNKNIDYVKGFFKIINNRLYYISYSAFNSFDFSKNRLNFYYPFSFGNHIDNYDRVYENPYMFHSTGKCSINSLFTKINYYYQYNINSNSIEKYLIDTVETNDSINTIKPIYTYNIYKPGDLLLNEKNNKLFEYSYRTKFKNEEEFNNKFEIDNLNNEIVFSNILYRNSNNSIKSLNIRKINEKTGKIILNKVFDLDDFISEKYTSEYNSLDFKIIDINSLNNGEYILRLKFNVSWYENTSDNRYYSDNFVSNTFQISKGSTHTYLLKFNKDLKIISKSFFDDNISKIISTKKGGFYTIDDYGVKISYYDNNLLIKWSKILSEQDRCVDLFEFDDKIYIIGSSKNAYRLDGDSPVIWILDKNGLLKEKQVIKLTIDSYLQSIVKYADNLYYILRTEEGCSMNKLIEKDKKDNFDEFSNG